jgi:hypothetical protein
LKTLFENFILCSFKERRKERLFKSEESVEASFLSGIGVESGWFADFAVNYLVVEIIEL